MHFNIVVIVELPENSYKRNFASDYRMDKGTSINDVPRFLAIFDLVLLYNVPFWGLSWNPLPTLILDVINGRSPKQVSLSRHWSRYPVIHFSHILQSRFTTKKPQPEYFSGDA